MVHLAELAAFVSTMREHARPSLIQHSQALRVAVDWNSI